MSNRTQRVLWTILVAVALCELVATVLLYRKNRQSASASATAPYHIVYTSMQEEDRANLVSINLQGGNARPLSTGDVLEAWPISASPASGVTETARIAYISIDLHATYWGDFSMPGGIYVRSLTDAELTLVSGDVSQIVAIVPAWSPDGIRLAFAGGQDENGDRAVASDELGIYVCDLTTRQVQRVTKAFVEGQRLAYSATGDYILVPIRRSNLPAVGLLESSSGTFTLILDGQATTACFSPDGQRLAAYAERRVHILPVSGSGTAYSLDVPAGGEVIELAWSPSSDSEGRLWAISSTMTARQAGQLFTRSASQSLNDPWEALTSSDAWVFDLTVSPDGRYALYSQLSGGGSVGAYGPPSADLYLLELSRPQPVRLTSDAGFEGLATWMASGK